MATSITTAEMVLSAEHRRKSSEVVRETSALDDERVGIVVLASRSSKTRTSIQLVLWALPTVPETRLCHARRSISSTLSLLYTDHQLFSTTFRCSLRAQVRRRNAFQSHPAAEDCDWTVVKLSTGTRLSINLGHSTFQPGLVCLSFSC